MRKKLAVAAAAATVGVLLATNPVVVEAAGQITSKQIKNNTIKGKDIKDGSIEIGDISSATVAQLKGNTGPAGPTGATGASAFTPPPAGTVVKGGGVLSAQVSGAGVVLRNYSDLPVTTKTPLVDNGASRNIFYGAGNTFPGAGDINATRCAGTFANPTATPGTLCVYVGAAGNMSAGSGQIFAGAADAAADGADSAGFYVFGSSAAAGNSVVRYSWAYTAH